MQYIRRHDSMDIVGHSRNSKVVGGTYHTRIHRTTCVYLFDLFRYIVIVNYACNTCGIPCEALAFYHIGKASKNYF